jgi:hypothetical protein
MKYGDRFALERVISRRDALIRGLLGSAGLVIGGGPRVTAQPASPSPRAKAIIQIWMWGGPSHLDTFDPKPGAGYDYCGPLDAPIPTKVDGIQIGQLLPLLAQQADKYSIIRSMTHGSNSHETAAYITQTGHTPDRLVYPCAGAVVSMFKGYEHGFSGQIPPYVVLTEPLGRFSEAGFLGPDYRPFATGGDPNKARFAVEGIISQGISDERQGGRRALMHELDALGKAMEGCEEFAALDRCEAAAYDLILGDARQLFELSREDTALRDRYGRNTFGQSCLMARRLVEHGIPYVAINYKGWDTHKQHFEIMQRKLPELDQGMSALLQDLAERGLLDSTIVWWGGEFGRTPKVLWEAPWNGGRGHFGRCFSAVVAGGGFKGGRVIGASDARGEEVAERPVHPRDLIATLYAQLGIDPASPLPNPDGQDIRVMPRGEAGGVACGLIEELL